MPRPWSCTINLLWEINHYGTVSFRYLSLFLTLPKCYLKYGKGGHMKTYKFYIAVLVLSACTNGKLAFQQTSKQAPKINCALNNIGNPAAGTQTLSSIVSNDTFFATPPVEGQTINFDCSQTVPDPSANQLTYYLDTNYNSAAPNFKPQNGAVFNFSALKPGSYPMAIQVTDGSTVSVKTFTLIVQRNDAAFFCVDTTAQAIL